MLKLRHLALGAGFLCITLAIFTQGVLPALQPQARETKVTRVVRTDLGELKWTASEASDYTPVERRGRRVYTIEGCWYCHSQYVRPVTGEPGVGDPFRRRANTPTTCPISSRRVASARTSRALA